MTAVCDLWTHNLERADKNNLLSYYSKVHVKALTQSMICSAFCKTGIWPINHHIIEQDAYAPALNTTTQASQPIAAMIPNLLVPVIVAPVMSLSTYCKTPSDLLSTPSDILSTPPSTMASSSVQSTPSEQDSDIQYVLKNLPPKLPLFASQDVLTDQNAELCYLLDWSCYQMQHDCTLKKLMERENG